MCYHHYDVAIELTKFLREREADYRRLEELLMRCETKSLKHFHREELRELGFLYRLAAADLARARYVLRSPLLTEYLNELAGRAHHMIHRKRSSIIPGLLRFVSYEFPSAVRREWKLVVLAAAMIIGTGIIGGISYHIDNDWGQLVLDQPGLRQYESSLEGGPSGLAAGIDENMMIEASTFIILNNIRACVVATAGGLLFGLGTMATLMFNGFLLGVIGTMFLTRGTEYNIYFWSGILPHGVLEIPAICIAGAAGFLLARGLLTPGRLTRGDAIRREGRTSMVLLGGVVLLLVAAGLIEGFITPMHVPEFGRILKIIFALLLSAGFVIYIVQSGRKQAHENQGDRYRTTTHMRLD